jgi:hypothetical protein
VLCRRRVVEACGSERWSVLDASVCTAKWAEPGLSLAQLCSTWQHPLRPALTAQDGETHVSSAVWMSCHRVSLWCVHLQERLQQALMQWQHPAAPLPPALLAAQASGSTGAVTAAATAAAAGPAAAAADRSKGDAAALLLRERAQQWREALRGAYIAMRHGHCPLVYICGQVRNTFLDATLLELDGCNWIVWSPGGGCKGQRPQLLSMLAAVVCTGYWAGLNA